jgi:hypothetical protein
MAILENGMMGGSAYVGVKLISISAGLEVGLCCARFTGSVSTSRLLEMRPVSDTIRNEV